MKNPYPDLESTVRNYVLGQLSESETEEFEAYYLSNPEIIEMIEVVKSIHVGMQNSQIVQSFYSDTRASTDEKSLVQKVINWISFPVPAYATLALSLVAAPLFLKGFYASPPIDELKLLSFSTVATRSASDVTKLDLSGVNGPAAVIVKIKKVEHQYYVLKLSSAESGESLWASNPFDVSALRDRMVVIPDSVIRDKVIVRVFGIEQDGAEYLVEFCHYSEICR